METAQELFSGLEKRARLAVGLARKIGQRMDREREAERQELARQLEIKRQQEIRATEEALKTDNKKLGLSRGRRANRGYDKGPGLGF